MNDAPLPTQIKDASDGIVLLKTGDFVVFHLQFRVGDGETISTDWQALSALEAIFVPWLPWDGVEQPTSLASTLPTVQSRAPADPTPALGRLLRAGVDQSAVKDYFADLMELGEEAYIESHFGPGRADIVGRMDAIMNTMVMEMIGDISRAGNIHALIQRISDAGLESLLDKFVVRN